MKKTVELGAVLFSLLLWSCGGDSSPTASTPTASTPTPVATSITLSVTSLSFASFGATSQLSATVKDQNGTTMSGASVTWSSSNTAVATVLANGLVTAISVGSATILAQSGSVSAMASVTVAQTAASLSANVRETRSTQRIRVGRRQRKRTCWDCEREWKRMVVPLEPGRPSEARQFLRTQR